MATFTLCGSALVKLKKRFRLCIQSIWFKIRPKEFTSAWIIWIKNPFLDLSKETKYPFQIKNYGLTEFYLSAYEVNKCLLIWKAFTSE